MNHEAGTKFERDTVRNIRIHVLPTDRFKTYAISMYAGCVLDEDNVTPTALIPFVLRRGSREYPETKAFRERLDDLYGAGFGFDVYKRGDYQLVQFRLDIIDDRYVQGTDSLLEDALTFLGGAVTAPYLVNGGFSPRYVEAEKDTLRKRQEAIVNDKIRYAAERCLEEMCAGEPYRLHPLGLRDRIAPLTPEALYARYREWLASAPIDLYVVGRTTAEAVKNAVERTFEMERSVCPAYEYRTGHKPAGEVKRVVERLDVGQGKLNMGLRTYTTFADDQYPALLMYNGVLGGYPHSKLFMNVREKASLAYYASSRLDGHKGILTVQSGIEIGNYDKAVRIIEEQLEQMRQGAVSELEMTQTKAMIANQLRESRDSAFETIALDFNGVLSGRHRPVDELIEDIRSVTAEQIARTAQQVKLDTIYFLRDREGGD
ncbi:EF-P 5-aminopentanol modification-associated protein YfmF [Paenibacillus thermoaerophilus]|uniref:EF-P 5-aminopentanol modification-associated protein YfmF n=1 Tax=Paenibacillus thermoaerophilus TaxID=1215385 RepID=A0ABW2V0X5_9BACL|nr:pitrilysin family protein [Paenibacillus thermoaerophilus]TMV13855.1 insulinase family protein [Paenibacillus thermoaerophilus]